MACDIYPYTHRALLWKHPCKYLPPCLLCCYSSHPRIVSFFLSLSPSLSLPRVRDSQLTVETTIQSVSHSPFFPLHSSLYQRNSSPLWIITVCLCVCVCERARAVGNSKKITNDELLWRWQISGGVTCVLQDSVSRVVHAVISWLWFLCSCNLSMDTLCSQRLALGPLCFEKSQLVACLLTGLEGQESPKSHVW